MAIQISGTNVIDNSRNLTNIANATTCSCPNTYVLRDANGNIAISEGALITALGPGTAVAGGLLICKASSVAWIVAPTTSEISRNWYCRNDAITRAQQVSGCTGWFVPTCGQLQNPGYTCRAYWDSYSSISYWSSTQSNTRCAFRVRICDNFVFNGYKTTTSCVRAFRCVSY